MKLFKILFLPVLATILFLSFFSCSESEADVVSATASAVFDFSDEENPPAHRLAVFFQVSNEVQRSQSFTVTNSQSGYSWFVAKPGIFTGMNKSYAYSVNLNAPEGEEIPVGAYSVIYQDAAGNEDSITFSVNYKKELLTAKAADCKEILGNVSENLAIYDDSGELLFMGKAKNSWKTNEAILKDYKLAETKRVCYVTAGNTVICMMPEEKLKTEN